MTKLRPEVELPRPRLSGAALVAVASLAMFTAVGASAFVVRVRMEQANWENRGRNDAVAPIFVTEVIDDQPPPVDDNLRVAPDNVDDRITNDVVIRVKNRSGWRVANEGEQAPPARAIPGAVHTTQCCDPNDPLMGDCPPAAKVTVKHPVVEVELVDVPRGEVYK